MAGRSAIFTLEQTQSTPWPRSASGSFGHATVVPALPLRRDAGSSRPAPNRAHDFARISVTAAERQADSIGDRIAADLPEIPLGDGVLCDPVKEVAERHLGVDLAGTRLRTGRARPGSPANAVTFGSAVTYMGSRPSALTSFDRHVLGHELTHVAQQRASGVEVAQGYRTSGCNKSQLRVVGDANSLAFQLARDGNEEFGKPKLSVDGEDLLARHAAELWKGAKILNFDGSMYFANPADRETAHRQARDAFQKAWQAFSSVDVLYDCCQSCSGGDYGYVDKLGDSTIHLCSRAVGSDADASAGAGPDPDAAALTVLHEFFHVVELRHPQAEEFAQIGYEVRFHRPAPVSKIDESVGATGVE
jgi:hypothetical protein